MTVWMLFIIIFYDVPHTQVIQFSDQNSCERIGARISRLAKIERPGTGVSYTCTQVTIPRS